jgi:CHAT domain-containing protein
LGTGAGGLSTTVAGEALYKGFMETASPESTLYVFVFDRERQLTLQNLTMIPSRQPERRKNEGKISVLFLAADPTNEARLRLGEELREIQEKLLYIAKHRDNFLLDQRMSVRPTDVSQALLDVEPKVVHFSGHGSAAGELCFENKNGQIQRIEPETLAALFEQFSDHVECVILNACYSEPQAKAISQHIKYVIGMNKAIGDRAAIAFSIGFYQALGAKRSIEEAFQLGKVQVMMQNANDGTIPILLKQHT